MSRVVNILGATLVTSSITQYSSTVYIEMALVYSVLKEIFDDQFQFVVYGKWNAYMCSKGTSG